MNPLILVATQLLPDLARLMMTAGDQSGVVEKKVVEAVTNVTGADKLPDAQAKIDSDAKAKADLEKALAEINAEEMKEQNRAAEASQRFDLEFEARQAEEREKAREEDFQRYLRDLQDRQDARAMQMKLADERSPLAWVAPLFAFALILMIWYLLHNILSARDEVANKDVFNVVLGALVTAFTTVVAYYFGSSLGSSKKDEALQSGRLVTNPKHVTKGDGGDDADGSLETGGDDTQPLDAPAARPSPSQAKGLGLFRSKAPRVMHDLIRDLGLTTVQAAAILGNIGHECAGFTLLQEQKPLRGGRGGWGWCQWTGSRRTEFEKWAADHGLDFSGDRANYGFLLEELKGSQANSVHRLKEAHSVDGATADFMNTFEKPAAQYAGLARRVSLAKLALQEYGRAYNA
jgi:Phage tail lysozyme